MKMGGDGLLGFADFSRGVECRLLSLVVSFCLSLFLSVSLSFSVSLTVSLFRSLLLCGLAPNHIRAVGRTWIIYWVSESRACFLLRRLFLVERMSIPRKRGWLCWYIERDINRDSEDVGIIDGRKQTNVQAFEDESLGCRKGLVCGYRARTFGGAFGMLNHTESARRSPAVLSRGVYRRWFSLMDFLSSFAAFGWTRQGGRLRCVVSCIVAVVV
ncbi:unnamed protein product [Ectocarpus sp. 12 AP-2014]